MMEGPPARLQSAMNHLNGGLQSAILLPRAELFEPYSPPNRPRHALPEFGVGNQLLVGRIAQKRPLNQYVGVVGGGVEKEVEMAYIAKFGHFFARNLRFEPQQFPQNSLTKWPETEVFVIRTDSPNGPVAR